MRAKRARAGTAVLAVAALVATAGLTGCSGRHGDGTLEVVKARGAVVVAADGSTRPATSGTRLARGQAVRTDGSGSAVLDLGGRRLYLGGDGLLADTTPDPGLLRGQLVVDAHGADSLRLAVGGFEVRVRGGAVTRVERLQAVRVGTLDGDTRVAVGGRALDVPALHQALAAGQALPARVTPLELRDDDAERLTAPDLVADDEQLQRTANALDSGGEGVRLVTDARAGLVLPASFDALPVAPGSGYDQLARRPSETALPLVIGRAAHPDRPALAAAAAAQVRGYRADDGSWGVVARLVGATARGADRELDALLAPAGSTPGGGAVLAAPAPAAAAPVDASAAAPPLPAPTPAVAAPTPSRRPTSSTPSRRPAPHPSGSPSPSPSSAVDQVTGVVHKVLPTPSPSAVVGVVGGLLGRR